MTKKIIEKLISLHKKVDVNRLSDSEWKDYRKERRELEEMLKQC